MLKKLMAATALTGMLVGTALAADDTSSSMSNPSATPPLASASTGSAKFVNSQNPDQYLATKFKGTDVIGADNQKIGDVSDILFDKDGKIQAYVVGVGGFLGIGSKDVAIAPASFKGVPGDTSKNESDKLQLSMTKGDLKQASNFQPYSPPRSTTGSGGSMGMIRSQSPAAPSTAPVPAPAAPK